MDSRDLLLDHFERVHELFPAVVDGLDVEAAHRRPGGTGNPIAWLLWHAARVQDDHVAGLSSETQAWTTGWSERLDLPYDQAAHGYGMSAEEVDALYVGDLQLLVDYQDAVHKLTVFYLQSLEEGDLEVVVDEDWDPPVTAGARLVSVLGDALQHLGQAAYVKGLPPV